MAKLFKTLTYFIWFFIGVGAMIIVLFLGFPTRAHEFRNTLFAYFENESYQDVSALLYTAPVELNELGEGLFPTRDETVETMAETYAPNVSIQDVSQSSERVLPKILPAEKVAFSGAIHHIFFHSLIVYPELAFDGEGDSDGYRDWMVTRDEFVKIIEQLYENNFILVDITSLYEVTSDGRVIRKEVHLPFGKKPLVLSLDDLSYYTSMKGNGFADKLVLDQWGEVATQITTPDGRTEVTRDGDVIPILDDFVKKHPDFSHQGAKGVIALTGFQGILGYRTNNSSLPTFASDSAAVHGVVSRLKETGWRFASHSYSHQGKFKANTISLEELKKDTELWDTHVRPLVGDTDIFIGPFGQVFTADDPRRRFLVEHGFRMFCGVDMNTYISYYSDSMVMSRANIDGFRMKNNPTLLREYFDPETVLDAARLVYRQKI